MRKHSSQLHGFGRVVTGSVLDCNKAALESSLKFFDPLLYIKWNPDKQDGRGCWEIRRTPSVSKLVCHGAFGDGYLYTSECKENDMVHHVLDCPVLHYGLLGKIKSMDTWKHKDYDAHLTEQWNSYEASERRKAREDLAYDIKQFKQEWRDMADLLNQGANPAQFIKGIRG